MTETPELAEALQKVLFKACFANSEYCDVPYEEVFPVARGRYAWMQAAVDNAVEDVLSVFKERDAA